MLLRYIVCKWKKNNFKIFLKLAQTLSSLTPDLEKKKNSLVVFLRDLCSIKNVQLKLSEKTFASL